MTMLIAAAAASLAACPVQEALLSALADTVEGRYVSQVDAPQIAAQIRAWSQTGRYSAECAEPDAFLQRLNRDLDAYDGHFHVERVGSPGNDDWLLSWRNEAKSVNAGLREVAVLEGNVGYLRISSFYPWDIARPKYLAAWSLLADVAGLIIDLRQNGGGDAEAAEQVVRSALGSEIRSVQSIDRRGQRTDDPLATAELPMLRATMPIIVLLDRRSASASEFVGYTLQQAKRAQIVGTRSAGAASMMGEPAPLPGKFQVIVPEARPVNAVSGTNWEPYGVAPDVTGGDDPVYIARRLMAGWIKSEQ
jgi:hypothetical protein